MKLQYVVINGDGAYVGAPCVSLEEAIILASEDCDRQIYKIEKLNNIDSEK